MKPSQSLALCLLCAFTALTSRAAETVTVLQILDGDTCRLSDSREVRYLGIDTPEKGDAFAEDATQAHNRLVGGKTIRLEFGKTRKDTNGRLLAYAFADKTFVNEELVRQGFAWVRRPVDAKYRTALLAAQDEARRAGRGLWSGASNLFIVVTEVHAKPAGGKTNLNDEYIVLENRGPTTVDMTGWSISDEAHKRYLVPNYVLAPAARVTLRTGLGKNTATDLYWGNRGPIWNDDGDSIFLRDAQARLVLRHIY